MTTAVELLVDIGQTLHGEHWRKALAHDLGKDHKEIWRWMTGKAKINVTVIERLIDLLDIRKVALGEEHKALYAAQLRIKDYLHQDIVQRIGKPARANVRTLNTKRS